MYGFKLPNDFLIGTANSAFQSEGAWDRDGKSESIMDHYAREFAGRYSPLAVPSEHLKPYTEELPDRGCFFYDHYEEYIEDMAKTGQNTYRMSLAWPRIIPDGVGQVNQKGIDHYNKVIDCLLAHNITPFVDLYHWDLPQRLMDKGGFLNPEFPEWFEAYAKVCFEAFGDRVKMWSTFNETEISVANGYQGQAFPPFYPGGIREKHLAGQHCLIAHFRAVRLYKSMHLGGKIGAVNCVVSVYPARINEEDLSAVEWQLERYLGWWTQPLVEGTYPRELMRQFSNIRNNMPENFQEELDKWFVPMDFLGINYYVVRRTEYDPNAPLKSKRVQNFYAAPGQAFAPYPPGLFDIVQYVSERYRGIELYITENGCALPNIHDEEKECDDDERISYLREHLRMVARLIRAGYTNLKGYYYWNDADSYEELDGYRLRFGLTWVDHETGKRRWKKSRYYFSQICKTHMID